MAILKLTLVTSGLLYAGPVGDVAFSSAIFSISPHRDPGAAGGRLTASSVSRCPLRMARRWLPLSPAQANRPTLLFLHGNAGEIADRADRLAFYQSRGYGVAFSWRAGGGSTGAPSETGLLTDAKAAYDHLRAKGIPADRIVLVGESPALAPP